LFLCNYEFRPDKISQVESVLKAQFGVIFVLDLADFAGLLVKLSMLRI
jgi:hypothetical protein